MPNPISSPKYFNLAFKVGLDVDDLFQNSIILTVFDDHGLPIFSGVLSYKNINHSNLENYVNNKNKTCTLKQIVQP